MGLPLRHASAPAPPPEPRGTETEGPAAETSPAHHAVLPYVSIALVLVFVRLCFTRSVVDDEVFHWPQIERFSAGDFTLLPEITTIPGYHACLALIARLLGTHSLEALRTVNVAIAIMGIGVFALLLRCVHGTVPAHRLLQFGFLPILFPYYFLVYTDVLSLLLVSAALLLALSGRHVAAAAVAIASMLVRQNNVVWLVMIPLLSETMRDVRLRPSELVRTGWPYAIGVLGFAGFVCWNGAIAMGARELHPSFTVHAGNVYLLLGLYGVLFLPSILAGLPRTTRTLREDRYLVVAIAALLAGYLLGFHPDHPWNTFAPDVFPRNRLLMAIDASTRIKLLAFVPIALAAADMLATQDRRRELMVVSGFIVLALVPAWLIEQRYCIVPVALLLLLRREEGPWVETCTTLAYVAVSLFLTWGIQSDRFFL